MTGCLDHDSTAAPTPVLETSGPRVAGWGCIAGSRPPWWGPSRPTRPCYQPTASLCPSWLSLGLRNRLFIDYDVTIRSLETDYDRDNVRATHNTGYCMDSRVLLNFKTKSIFNDIFITMILILIDMICFMGR